MTVQSLASRDDEHVACEPDPPGSLRWNVGANVRLSAGRVVAQMSTMGSIA